MRKRILGFAVGALLLTGVVAVSLDRVADAQTTSNNGEFSLQVTPSPLVATVKPGQTTELELQIRNAGTAVEELKIEPRAFRFDDATGQVSLQDTTPPDIAAWVSLSNPTFTIQPGAWFTQKVRVSLPKDSGFSYSFALVISRTKAPAKVEGRVIKGSLAVFTLINVDRPGATSKLQVVSFTASKKVYEYLPAELSVRLKNTGNTIVQPYGNIFVGRGGDPISTLKVNENKGYILPDTSRTLKTEWTEGFPVYETVTEGGKTSTKTVWNWANAADFRLGRYTAKLVAVYSDGKHDIPIEGEVSFWVIPWKILLGMFIVFLLVLVGLWSLVRKIIRGVKRIRKPKKAETTHEKSEEAHTTINNKQ
ncbi:hypothetical protein EYC59_03800 [Candidatus Saccharibacteria bacterium]|nr:MAG: hypothetical protein EYC59_03800 [Candidatus Saccharibacteria bacterium]